MANNVSSILAAAYYDQCCEDDSVEGYIGMLPAGNLKGSLYNRLLAMRLITIDVSEGGDYGADALASAWPWRTDRPAMKITTKLLEIIAAKRAKAIAQAKADAEPLTPIRMQRAEYQ